MAAVCGIFIWGMGWHDVRKNVVENEKDYALEEGKSEQGL
jgi:hypothetical protein